MRTPLLTSLSLLFVSGCEQFYINVDKDTVVDTETEETHSIQLSILLVGNGHQHRHRQRIWVFVHIWHH